MENPTDTYYGGRPAPFPAATTVEVETREPCSACVVPAQPALPDLGYDDALLEADWPPFTAWWMLGGDSD